MASFYYTFLGTVLDMQSSLSFSSLLCWTSDSACIFQDQGTQHADPFMCIKVCSCKWVAEPGLCGLWAPVAPEKHSRDRRSLLRGVVAQKILGKELQQCWSSSLQGFRESQSGEHPCSDLGTEHLVPVDEVGIRQHRGESSVHVPLEEVPWKAG